MLRDKYPNSKTFNQLVTLPPLAKSEAVRNIPILRIRPFGIYKIRIQQKF